MPFERRDTAHHPEQLLAHHAPDKADRSITPMVAAALITGIAGVLAILAMVIAFGPL